MSRRYPIDVLPAARAALGRLDNKKTVREIARAIDGLARDPDRQGRALAEPLEGLRSLRAARDRFRVVYRIDADRARVVVQYVGERRPGRPRDVYRLAAALLERLTGRRGTSGD